MRTLSVKSFLAPGQDKILTFHTQRVGYPVDVIEIGDNLGGIVDAAVIQPGCPQRFNVGTTHFGGVQRQLFGIRTQHSINST